QQVIFGPDGRLLASVSADKTAILWDAVGGQNLRTFTHTGAVHFSAFSPDGRLLATAARRPVLDQAVPDIRLWEVSTGRQVGEFVGSGYFKPAVAFSPDGRLFAWTTGDGGVSVRDVAADREGLRCAEAGSDPCHLAFSPDSRRLAMASGQDGLVAVWDVRPGPADEPRRPALRLKGHSREVAYVAFSPDGERLATASYDDSVKLWELRTGTEL